MERQSKSLRRYEPKYEMTTGAKIQEPNYNIFIPPKKNCSSGNLLLLGSLAGNSPNYNNRHSITPSDKKHVYRTIEEQKQMEERIHIKDNAQTPKANTGGK